MSINSFGHIFRVTTWGESHGTAIGATIDGCPPGISITEELIQNFLDKRKPGQNKFTTQRKEADKVSILSGVFEKISTGTPIQLLINNTDQKSKDYGDISEKFRPGHADYTYFLKYGIRDYRGGGRSSARETAARVAAGAIAQLALKELQPNLEIYGYMIQLGNKKINANNFNLSNIPKNSFWCPDSEVVSEWEDYLLTLRKSGDSVGAIIEITIKGAPGGLGAPIYAKLDADLASSLMSINAVKGVELGNGMDVAKLAGSDNADEMFFDGGNVSFGSNHAGGILGGISTGQDIVTRFSVKPTSSILKPKQTINKKGDIVEIRTKGRHDPCVGIRAVPVGEAMVACVILDHFLLHRGQNGKNQGQIG
ncbi:MAG: chorismate synthase [Paracoccaceae bacterium]|nr:chorismate synthase [Paracoccaceae bacterium]